LNKDGSLDLNNITDKQKTDAPGKSDIPYLRLTTKELHLSAGGKVERERAGLMARVSTQNGTPDHPGYTASYLKLAA
jgi:hypothetical protein